MSSQTHLAHLPMPLAGEGGSVAHRGRVLTRGLTRARAPWGGARA
ncbi:hypothetical protein ACFQU3_04230 [Terrabacter sp. GCM10028922]